MDMVDIVRYLGALLLVLALVGAAGLALRRFGLPGVTAGASRRLTIVETLMMGRSHRVCLIRCDATEHVVVIGPQGATLLGSTALEKPSA